MRVMADGVQPGAYRPALVLEEANGDHRLLPVWIGAAEANAITAEQHPGANKALAAIWNAEGPVSLGFGSPSTAGRLIQTHVAARFAPAAWVGPAGTGYPTVGTGRDGTRAPRRPCRPSVPMARSPARAFRRSCAGPSAGTRDRGPAG